MRLDSTQQKAIAFASNFVEEADIETSENYMHIRAMDVGRVCMVDMEVFNSPDGKTKPLSSGTTRKFHVNLTTLAKALAVGSTKKDHLPELTFTPELKAILAFDDGYKVTMGTLAVSDEEIPIPKLKDGWGMAVETNFSKLASAAKFLKTENVFFHVVADRLIADLRNEINQVETWLNGDVKGRSFAVNLNWGILEPLTKIGEVKAFFSTNMPLKVEYRAEGVNLDFYGAPRIDDGLPAPEQPTAAAEEVAAREGDESTEETEEHPIEEPPTIAA